MPLTSVTEIRGLQRTRRVGAGELQACTNFIVSKKEGIWVARTRPYLSRMNTSYDSGIFINVYELRKDDDTQVKLIRTGTKVRKFTLPGTFADLKTGLTSNLPTNFCSGLDKAYFCNETDGNFVTDGTNVWDLVEPNEAGASISVSESSTTATGFGTGTYRYMFSYYDSTSGWETIVGGLQTVVKSDANKGVDVSFSSATLPYNTVYDSLRVYRRALTDNAWYLIQEQANTTSFTDILIETDFTAAELSKVHDNNTGLANMEDPGNFHAICFHKGRIFGSIGDEVHWNKEPNLPFTMTSDGLNEFQIGDDGDKIETIVSYKESLVVFKQNSIWVMNGDTNTQFFTFFPVTKKLGIWASKTYVCTPVGILFFGSDSHFYLFNLTPESITDPIPTSQSLGIPTSELSTDLDDRRYCSAGYSVESRTAYFSFYRSSDSSTVNYILPIDGFAFTQLVLKRISGNKEIYSYGEFTDADDKRVLVCGSDFGDIFTLESDASGDGVPSGTVTGSPTAGASNTLTDGGASFYTTGNGLINVTVVKVEPDGTTEVKTISSNTSTVLTISGTWAVNPTVNDTYYIGAYDALLWLGQIDHGSPDFKRYTKIRFILNAHSGFKYGASVDVGDGSSISSRSNYREASEVASPGRAQRRIIFPVQRRGYSVGPFVEAVGTSLDLEVHQIDIDGHEMRGKIS